MPALERILTFGVTGGGKTFQWMKVAEILKPTGARFRCIDTDNDIGYMLETQFPSLIPKNGGNVYVHRAFGYAEHKLGINWIQRSPGRPLTKEQLDWLREFEPDVLDDYRKAPLKPIDWTILDKASLPWRTAQDHFIHEVFGEDMGEYFLQIRREIERGQRRTKDGKALTSTFSEGLDGWKDWSVINKLYDDFMLPIVYRLPTHVYATASVERINRGEKDAELVLLFGDLGVRPSGQKDLGGQMHTIFLLIPGKDEWFITTVKDRANRPYFKRTRLKSLYLQYLVAKAHWPVPE